SLACCLRADEFRLARARLEPSAVLIFTSRKCNQTATAVANFAGLPNNRLCRLVANAILQLNLRGIADAPHLYWIDCCCHNWHHWNCPVGRSAGQSTGVCASGCGTLQLDRFLCRRQYWLWLGQ